MAVKRGECHLVEIYEPDAGDTRPGKSGGTVRSDTAAANYDNEAVAEFLEA